MNSLRQLFLGLLLTFSCSGQQTTDRQVIEKSVHNFYDWYIGTVKDGLDYKLALPVEGTDGMTKLDTKEYFEKLKSLGTISETFIDSEKARLKICDDFLRTVTWEKYQQADGYEYEDKCDFLHFYYWIFSQEEVDGIKIKKVTVDKNVSVVELTFIVVQDGKEIDMDYNIHVGLERQGKDWFLNKIERK